MNDDRKTSGNGAKKVEGEEEFERLIFFKTGAEWFALRVDEIREVVQRTQVTRIPNAPAVILGIMNLRGKVLTIFDMDSTLGLPAARGKERLQVIILNLPDPEVDLGFLVDQVAQIRELSTEQIREISPSALGKKKGLFFRGALYYDAMVVNIINPFPIISSLVPELEEASG